MKNRYIVHHKDGTLGIIETYNVWKFLNGTSAIINGHHIYLME